MSEFDKRDQELQQRLRQTLDELASRPDPLLDAALAATRAQIAERRKPRRSAWWMAGGFAVAASLAVVLVLPTAQGPAPAVPVLAAGSMPDADLQLLEDMDMLAALVNES